MFVGFDIELQIVANLPWQMQMMLMMSTEGSIPELIFNFVLMSSGTFAFSLCLFYGSAIDGFVVIILECVECMACELTHSTLFVECNDIDLYMLFVSN